MHLSNIYNDRYKYVLIYHTGDYDSEEVELVTDQFFDSEKAAWDYFHRYYRTHHFVQPEVVKYIFKGGQLARLDHLKTQLKDEEES